MSNKKKTTIKKEEKTKNTNKLKDNAEKVSKSKETTKSKNTTNKNKNQNKTAKAKKVEHQNPEIIKNTNNEMAKLLKIVLIVTGIMLVFYGITLLVTNKADETLEKQNNENQTEETPIQYENIIIGSMLSHGGTYYVLIEKEDDNRIAEYDSIITTIKSSEDAPIIYKANLTDSFNKNYLGKEQNYYVDDLSEFKVTSTVLVKVKDGKIDSVSDTYDAIKNKLKDLA